MRVWTTTRVRHFIDTRLGIEYCRERVRQWLHGLGCRRRRTRHHRLQATGEAQVALKAEWAAWLTAWPEDWAWLCVDEATVRRHPPLTAPWGLADEVPEVPTGDEPARVQVYGAVAPLTGRTHDHVGPVWGRGACAPCLRPRLRYSPRQRRLVIHDRGAPHQGAPVEAVVREADGRLLWKPQPASSPELNPQERMWKWLRRIVTHHHGFPTRREPRNAIRNCFRDLADVNVQVRHLCGVKTSESLVASL
jgi:DDE superfamily endonuclease/Winged helix-turn helix